MTLILARASAEFILQVSDRLVSYTGTGQPFDKVSNKSILYIASNAVVSMAYTGVAYLENKPTDHWLAEKLSGLEINLAKPPSFIGKEKNNQDIGLTFRKVANEIIKLQQKRDLFLLISFQGWQWTSKGRLRPIVGSIEKVPPSYRWGIKQEPRDWFINGSAMTIATPRSNISQEELADLSNRLRHKPAQEAELLMIEKIREVSQRIQIVGPHCMSILIPPPSNPNITIQYHYSDNSALSNRQQLDDKQEVWGYSPWIISPNLCLLPSQVVGDTSVSTGLFTVHLIAGTQKHPFYLYAMQGQKRPRRP